MYHGAKPYTTGMQPFILTKMQKKEHLMPSVCVTCKEPLRPGSKNCPACGHWNTRAPQAPAADGTPYSSDYDVNIKPYATHFQFIIGSLFITLGTIVALLFDLSFFSFLGFGIDAIFIMGLWLVIYDGFSSDESYANTLAALNMFRVSTILIMVMTGIIFGLLGIIILFSVMSGIFFLFVLALVGGIGFLLFKFYFFAILSILNGIRTRIYNRQYAPLDGLNSFLIISYIGIAASIILILVNLFIPTTRPAVPIYDIQSDYLFLYLFVPAPAFNIEINLVPSGTSLWEMLFALVHYIGRLLCLRVLKCFANP